MNGITAAYTGHVTKDAEVRNTRDGKPWLSFNAAVDATRAADEGPTWVRTALFGDAVEAMAPQLTKGASVYVEGRLAMNTWEGKDGQQRTGLSVTASRIEILGQIGRRAQQARPSR